MSRDRYEMLEYDGKLYSEIQHLESENDDLKKQVKELEQENKQLKEDKRKAKKYIDEEVLFEDMFSEGEDTFLEDVNTKYYKGLKELLGDKENE